MISMRLMRFGSKKKPSYRIVVTDSKNARQSKALDFIGTYDPVKEPIEAHVDYEKAKAWLAKGAKASQTVQSLLDNETKSKKTSA